MGEGHPGLSGSPTRTASKSETPPWGSGPQVGRAAEGSASRAWFWLAPLGLSDPSRQRHRAQILLVTFSTLSWCLSVGTCCHVRATLGVRWRRLWLPQALNTPSWCQRSARLYRTWRGSQSELSLSESWPGLLPAACLLCLQCEDRPQEGLWVFQGPHGAWGTVTVPESLPR